MKLQFFYVKDLCRFIDTILEKKPSCHIFNVGNKESISITDWVKICYKAVGKVPEFVNVYHDIDQRNYFCFYNYEYCLDVNRQYELLKDVMPLKEGIRESYQWYLSNKEKVMIKPYIQYIDENFR